MYGAANGRTTGEAGFRSYAGGGPGAHAPGWVKLNTGQEWRPADDQWLWANKQIEKPCNLAAHLGRSVKAIWARLKFLEIQNGSNRLKRQRSANGSSEAATELDRAFGSTAPKSKAAEAKTSPHSTLNTEQVTGAECALTGQSCFFTGAAGTGKTYLLSYVVQALRALHSAKKVAVVAPTGTAASHIQGVTIHSFAGIGLGEGTYEVLLAKVLANSGAVARWRACQVLVVDEVSMLDNILFEMLEAIARAVRGVAAPFGGIQLVTQSLTHLIIQSHTLSVTQS